MKGMSTESASEGKPVLLVYMDRDAFQDKDDLLYRVVTCAMDKGVRVLLVHEVSSCPFELFFATTPRDLIDPPYELFKDIAVPLYTDPIYRLDSLRQVLTRLTSRGIY
jgi:hypothetical protein